MNIAVPKEKAEGERRVALVPDTVARLVKAGHAVRVEHAAGTRAGFPEDAYSAAGASVVAPDALFAGADLIVTVGRPVQADVERMPEGAVLIGILAPLADPAYLEVLAARKLRALSMDMLPRITRAQSMDVLSSQSNIAGYKAVIIAAAELPKFFPMLTTAAGTIPPAKVLILGAGVAGLQAIATARRLGAVVSGYDVRAVVKEQVQSLGANFLEFDLGADAEAAGGYAKELTPEQAERQREWMIGHIAASDVVIPTALVPGRRAPILITAPAVERMRPGSVIVDVAADAGGNCELTEPGETIVHNGVTIVGTKNLPATMPLHASQLYSRNVAALLDAIVKDGKIALDREDEIVKGTLLTEDGTVLHGRPAPAAAAAPSGA
ncbi:MAG: Re/Si-specific NAD(P)(+) transhydrogenase subunit alpha [Candidatus Eremiobacteraeota bacterium]|nr:Re/Si-specific NAD(P)(+) transhydrogenase subunit alpha [Candidatus Eremiobacteraeota bacterium]